MWHLIFSGKMTDALILDPLRSLIELATLLFDFSNI